MGRAPRAKADRQRELVRVAYRQLTEKGFEGLRVRDVAREAGVNHATLLYYFPTKEALIQGVMEYLLQEFRTNCAPRSNGEAHESTPAPLAQLRYEFADLRYRFRETPEMFVVLTELATRGRRDPDIARILDYRDTMWHGYLVSILERGVREGVFRLDLDVATTATAIMVQLKAIGYLATAKPDGAEIDRIDRLVSHLAAQTEYWLTGRHDANEQE
jgi:AcrR family transcriptional regulator